MTKAEAEKLANDHSHFTQAIQAGTTIKYRIKDIDVQQVHNTEEYVVIFQLESETGLMAILFPHIKKNYILS